MSAKFKLVKVEDSQADLWNETVKKSSSATVFHHKSFLDKLGQPYSLFWIYKGDHLRGGISLLNDPLSAQKTTLHNLVIYNGLFFCDDLSQSSTQYANLQKQYEVIDAVVSMLPQHFSSVEMRLSPWIKDLRPFQWFNYHNTDATKKYQLQLRYTSLLDLTSLDDVSLAQNEGDGFLELSPSRRQEIRYATKDGVEIQQTSDPSCFLELYREMAISYEPQIDETLAKLKELLTAPETASLFQIYQATSAEGVPVGAAVFGTVGDRSFYLYGVTSKADRERYSGSMLLWKIFADLKQKGVRVLDMEGVNSPNRGWFKLSFGGTLEPYFIVRVADARS